jgi:hypothetical protein
MRQPAIIGEAPARNADPSRPLAGRAGRVICLLAGWECDDPHEELSRRFFLVNLLDEWPGRAGKGTVWPAALARRRAEALREALSGRLAALLLGWRVAGAFGIRDGSYGLWRPEDELVPARHAVLPHPSGINRALNDQDVRIAAGTILREVGDVA